ncbi:PadR family transcriptional regulator [Temperatibacter marinus]|uniref:PadR family transcriptional regulator n=1 Tax=Temperatibacter marinus TaxID=1456591 RepID=A0AA52EKR7_9PROT|nr:PadR family transcriptional regulator [Temperatibacter marinus]WND04049.1 PadR family transcriptional regulator [Temperatibacter marinus]
METTSDQVIERWIPQFKKGLLEFLILMKLQHDPLYGYEMAIEIKKLTSINLAEGTLYPLLNRLKRDGLVETEWQTEASGPPRKYYQITPMGRETLEKMKTYWTETHSSVLKMVNSG